MCLRRSGMLNVQIGREGFGRLRCGETVRRRSIDGKQEGKLNGGGADGAEVELMVQKDEQMTSDTVNETE